MSADRQGSPPAIRSGKGRVLLMTDRASQMVSIIEPLEAAGFTVITTSGMAAGLVALRRSVPHLIILDLSVKTLAAAEISRMINDAKIDDGGGTPIIYIGQGAPTAERQLEAISQGAFDYFQELTDPVLLLARAAQLVALRQTMVRLYEETNRDWLTGLANRRLFRFRLGQELERWRRYQIPCALALVDIDHMKRINDTYGHTAGDMAIRHVADALIETAQANDLAARLGGEEFAILLAGADEAKAVRVAEHLHRIISREPVRDVGAITISVGVAACPVHADSERKLYTASDNALYRAKNEGRNRTATATQSSLSPDE